MNTHASKPSLSEEVARPSSLSSFDSSDDGGIDLYELWSIIWAEKLLIAAVTGLSAIAAVLFALSLPNIYRSEALLAPSQEVQGGGLGQMAGQLGGLASLAGISLTAGAGTGQEVIVALEVLQSRQFVAEFADKYSIAPELIAVSQWSPETNRLAYDRALYDPERDRWVREVEPPKQQVPSSWEVYDAFMEVLSVSRDDETGLVTVAVEHQSPYVAQRWASLLVKEVNAVMKREDMEEAKKSIQYLQRQLENVAIAEMRTVFYQLIEEQTKTVMLAEVRDEYIFSTIDAPVVPEEKAWPNRALICVVAVIVGGIFSVMIAFFVHLVRLRVKES